ncbi:MAG: hypothetical protein H6754_02075 [Candidatus Omnitrophica bacterium]|nr:hypothetical protein [Candidatus Omnitrophota bacterium]
MKLKISVFLCSLCLVSIVVLQIVANSESKEQSIELREIQCIPKLYVEGFVTEQSTFEESNQSEKTYLTKMPIDLGERICLNIEDDINKKLTSNKYIFSNVKLSVEIKKINHITYLNDPIIEEVEVLGFANNMKIFSVYFSQKRNYIDFRFWKSIKTPEQIGVILSKKILKEITPK